MRAILIDFQLLISSAIAIVAAIIGLGGVVYSERQSWRNSERERKHREEMQKELHEQERRRTLDALLSALSGELAVMHERIHKFKNALSSHKSMFENASKYSNSELYDMPWRIMPKFSTPIFDAHVQSIGFLPPTLSHSVAGIYATLKYLGTTSERNQQYEANLVRATYDILEKLLSDLTRDLHDVVLRLHAVRLGQEDPGVGAGAEWSKKHDGREGGA
jgi:hypothetical protein